MTPRSPSASGWQRLHVGGGQPHHVEGADQVDPDDALEVGERHRPVAADDALGRSDAGAVDQDARRAMGGGGRFDRRFAGGRIGDVAGEGRCPSISAAISAAALSLTSSTATLAPASASVARDGGAEARAAAGHDGGLTFDFHETPPAEITRDDNGVA